jgi:hypothetical protein
MTDLTKILKVGDKVWDYRYGEGKVSEIKTPSNKWVYCIRVILPNGVNAQWLLYQRWQAFAKITKILPPRPKASTSTMAGSAENL